MGYDRAGTNYRTRSDMHPFQKYRPRPNPNVIFDDNRRTKSISGQFRPVIVSFAPIHWVTVIIQNNHIRCDQTTLPDGHGNVADYVDTFVKIDAIPNLENRAIAHIQPDRSFFGRVKNARISDLNPTCIAHPLRAFDKQITSHGLALAHKRGLIMILRQAVPKGTYSPKHTHCLEPTKFWYCLAT